MSARPGTAYIRTLRVRELMYATIVFSGGNPIAPVFMALGRLFFGSRFVSRFESYSRAVDARLLIKLASTRVRFAQPARVRTALPPPSSSLPAKTRFAYDK